MNIKKIISECKKINKEYHYFNVIDENPKSSGKGKLAGVVVSVKDCICVKGMESRAGSKILSGYKPTFDATVIDKVRKAGGIIVGKTAQDEFGFGSFSINVGKGAEKSKIRENQRFSVSLRNSKNFKEISGTTESGFEIPLNPLDKTRACGGSSGGSAGITKKADFPHISLAESTGGSIVNPASFCGVVGLCPTYGRVSRYGLIDYANSLDKIGPIGKTVYDCALMLEVIAGFDENESTTLDVPVEKYTSYAGKDVKAMKIGIIIEGFGSGVDKDVALQVESAICKLEEAGVKTEKISLPITMKYGIPVYYLIATAESSTNLAKYCGMRYGKSEELKGNFNEYFSKVRSENFGDEVKRRIMLGTFARMAGYRDAYYIKAMKVRNLIIEEYKNLFKKFDALVSPTMPISAPKIEDIKKLTPLQNYMMDVLTVGPNLAGLPHISVPVGGKLPVGLMLIGDHLQEGKIIQLGSKLEAAQK